MGCLFIMVQDFGEGDALQMLLHVIAVITNHINSVMWGLNCTTHPRTVVLPQRTIDHWLWYLILT